MNNSCHFLPTYIQVQLRKSEIKLLLSLMSFLTFDEGKPGKEYTDAAHSTNVIIFLYTLI